MLRGYSNEDLAKTYGSNKMRVHQQYERLLANEIYDQRIDDQPSFGGGFSLNT